MPAEWNQIFDPKPIIDRLQDSRVTAGDGQPSFEGFAHKECIALLHDMLLFPRAIPETERRRILNQATMQLRAGPALTSSSLLAAVNEGVKDYLKSSPQKYVLVTTLSVRPPSELPFVSHGGSQIRFPATIPAPFLDHRTPLEDVAKLAIFADLPSGYQPVLVRLAARSPYEAAENALDALDLNRAIWNWFYNRRHHIRMSFGSQDPVNKVHLGPFHSLHRPGGALATETFWFEPSFRAPVKLQDVSPDLERLTKFFSFVRRYLRKSHYIADMQTALLRYVRALDERDWHAGFLKLWGVLEHLTATTKDESYASTAKRAGFVFRERDYFAQVMKVLIHNRNGVVHAAASSGEIETLLYQLKNVVEALIEFHLGTTMRFASLQHAAEFLSLPGDREVLQERAKMVRYAQHFKGYRPPTRRTQSKGAA